MISDYSQDPLIGQQLDEYRLDAVLGQGGMARVYRGFDVRLKRPTAIKVIQGSFRSSPEYEVRFEREAQAIARLRHPHIVGVYRYGRTNDLFYLAMEYIEGEDLQTRLAAYEAHQKLMPPAEAGRIIHQVCLALDYTHSQGVVHRDVKPSNIMLDKDGRALLTDFGLALLDRNTQGEIFGTPDYIAPEQAMSSAGAVPQSDLYAMGVILYEIFTGGLPFVDTEPLALAMRHLTDPPPLPRKLNPDISLGLEAVILKALAKDPQDRYPNGAALSGALDEALRLNPQDATPPDKQDESLLPPTPAAVMSPAAEKQSLQTIRYRWTNIRALLIEGFSAEELIQLCFDEFRPVYNQLSLRRGKTEIVELLLEYADQALLVDKLLALAQERNPARYEKHEPYQEKFTSRPSGSLKGVNLGPYSVGEWLGQGGMAEVYKAYDSHLNRQVAVKVIHDHLNDDVEFIERFENEAIMLAGLRHPNIVQVIDRGQTERFHYMVMEFVPGHSLEAKLKERQARGQPFTPVEAVPIVEELASAIDYAHNQGVIHHDLKPNNILFTADGQIVLTDFGIARIVALPNYTVPGLVLGTPAYMAPEQARGQRGDPRSDVYSMGVLLYEMMTGRVPLKARTPWEMVMKYTNEQPPPPASINPAISPAVERVILKALSQSPDKRYQTARGLARALAKAVRSPQPPPLISSSPSTTFAYDVFISYSPDERSWVQQELWPWLEQAGLRVCIDLRDFQPGAPRPTEMERAVLTSRKTLLILTQGYLESEWDEFGNLMLQTLDPAARQRRLIPLRKEKCDLPVRLSYLWSVDFVEPADQDLAWTQLLTALNAPLT